MMQKLNENQQNILIALAQYKFLTSPQMVRLNIEQNLQDLELLQSLKLVKSSVSIFPAEKEVCFFLLTKGVDLVSGAMNIPETNIKYASNVFYTKYLHYKKVIDCEIEARLCAPKYNYDTTLFDRSFDKIRSGKKIVVRSRIETQKGHYINPDGCFILDNKKDQKLFTLDLYQDQSVKGIIKQLSRHTYAIENGSVGLKYNIERLHRVLNIFKNESKMMEVIEELKTMTKIFNEREMELFFFFKTVENIGKGKFYKQWLNLEGKESDLLQ